jgi:hypothetical protein
MLEQPDHGRSARLGLRLVVNCADTGGGVAEIDKDFLNGLETLSKSGRKGQIIGRPYQHS